MLTVFTVADETYEPFVLPYIASVLHHNAATTVEILLEKPLKFEQDNADALAVLANHYGDRRIVIGRGDFTLGSANALRFRHEPVTKNEYVYIGDIDILILEAIGGSHLDHMKKTGLAYSNIQRKGANRLTGLHFTEWDALYPLPAKRPDTPRGYDEHILWDAVQDKGNAMPDPTDAFRPLHGYHMTLSRPPASGWGGLRFPANLDAYLKMTSSPAWTQLLMHFDPKYLSLLTVLEAALFSIYPDRQREMPARIMPRATW